MSLGESHCRKWWKIALWRCCDFGEHGGRKEGAQCLKHQRRHLQREHESWSQHSGAMWSQCGESSGQYTYNLHHYEVQIFETTPVTVNTHAHLGRSCCDCSVDGSPEGSALHFDQSFAFKTADGFAGGVSDSTHTYSAPFWPSSPSIVWLLNVAFCSWHALSLHYYTWVYVFIRSFFSFTWQVTCRLFRR